MNAASGFIERRFSFLRQSSLAPGGKTSGGLSRGESKKLITAEQLDATLQLLFYAAQGNLLGVKEILDQGTSTDAADFDLRRALHVAACEDRIEVVKLLLDKGANVNVEDRWGSTPLADARHYGNIDICNVLEQRGGKMSKESRNSLMRIPSSLVPEYEIDQSTLKFDPEEEPSKKVDLYRSAVWNGTKVWVYFLPGISIAANDHLVAKFREELALLLKLRHPNVVQFLGAVTQTSPMMIVTEFLSGGNLKTYMEENKRLELPKALCFALDIARGLNCIHEHRPESIVHGDLKPSNLLVDASSRHIKVANFGVSQSLKEGNTDTTVEHNVPLVKFEGSICRYMAPEIIEGTAPMESSADTFAFGIILQEMLEGRPPFSELKDDHDVARAYAEGRRPPFRHGGRRYPPNIKELIEECWDKDPKQRPLMSNVIQRLEHIRGNSNWKTKLKAILTRGS